MSIQALKGVWWKKVDRSEKLWLGDRADLVPRSSSR